MKIPKQAKKLINLLENKGYTAYVVGGFVRDSIMQKNPYDCDICTSAMPNEMIEVFNGYTTIQTGIKHGTITVLVENIPIEITTFRQDGNYLNHRKPENVCFVRNLQEDLKRRDFTINAMAYNEKTGLIDLFGGVEDIQEKLIKTVGNSHKRFEEDCLRILRGLRFASTLGFELETETQKAMLDLNETVIFASAERKNIELSKMIVGKYFCKVLIENKEILTAVIPELGSLYNEKWEQIFKNTPQNLELRLAILFLNSKNPKDVLTNLKYSKKIINKVTNAISFCNENSVPKTNEEILLIFNKYTKETTMFGFDVMCCVLDEKSNIKTAVKMAKDLIENNSPYKIADLKITGNDIKNVGIASGKDIGIILQKLIILVIKKRIENNKASLIQKATEFINELK